MQRKSSGVTLTEKTWLMNNMFIPKEATPVYEAKTRDA